MPLVAGLNPNIRLVPPPQEEKDESPVDIIVTEDGGDVTEFDDKGNVVTIKHGDGSVTDQPRRQADRRCRIARSQPMSST